MGWCSIWRRTYKPRTSYNVLVRTLQTRGRAAARRLHRAAFHLVHAMFCYTFGDFKLIPADRQLLRADKPVPIAPKVFETLVLLVSSQGRLVEKDEFLRRVWPGTFIQEVGLAHAVSELRKVLRDDSGASNFIETVPKRGYRFIAPVEVLGGGSAGTAPVVTLAVLPFEDLSRDEEREYLADGLTEEVITALGQVDPEHLSVIGRTSAMTYKRTGKSLATIARELGAAFLVEGSIRGEGERLRITSRLIRGVDHTQIWSDTYDGEPTSVIEFQRDLSSAIAQQVHLRLSPERLQALALRQTTRVEAHHLYLRGRYFWHQLSPLTTRRAVEYYSRAAQIDPGYALAWSGLADAFAASPINGDASPLEMWPRAREAAAKAVAAGPNLAETRASLGLLKFWLDWDWRTAETAFRKAIDLDPAYGFAHRTLGIVLSYSGRHAEAIRAVGRARELDPLDAAHQALSAQIAFNARHYEAAITFARQATVLDPEFWVGHLQLAQAYEQVGGGDSALAALQTAGRFSGGNSKVTALRGYIFAKLGRIDEAQEALNTLQSRERYVPPYATALVYAGLGQRGAALQALLRAYEAHDVHLALLPVEPKWDAFRAEPGFAAVLERCSFITSRADDG